MSNLGVDAKKLTAAQLHDYEAVNVSSGFRHFFRRVSHFLSTSISHLVVVD